MEKFRIGLYGLAQVMAISYGVLASGAAAKFNRPLEEMGYAMTTTYYRAIFYRDHGYWLLFLVVIWAVAMSWFSSQWSEWQVDEGDISATGIVLALGFVALGTWLAFGAAMPPPSLYTTHFK